MSRVRVRSLTAWASLLASTPLTAAVAQRLSAPSKVVGEATGPGQVTLRWASVAGATVAVGSVAAPFAFLRLGIRSFALLDRAAVTV